MKKYTFLFSIILLGISTSAWAQKDRSQSITRSALNGLEYEVKAGINIGGTAPLPLPEEIRSIDSYVPSLAISISGEVTKWLDIQKQWGIIVGLRLENKNMKTKATVKNYSMEIIGKDGSKVSGAWTGGVRTKVNNAYLSLPILATYKVSSRWNLKAGPYVSYLLDGEFSGDVYEGYLREGNPTGNKVEFVDEQKASYDFSTDLRNFTWGMQFGANWRAFKHLNVYADLTWGMSDIFKKDFNTISFAMYPIYLNVGFGYAF